MQCGLASRVTVVDGKMVLIDRERKLIALQNSNAILRYDYLIITTGLQVWQSIILVRLLTLLQENTGNQLPVEVVVDSNHSSEQTERIHKEDGVNGTNDETSEKDSKRDGGIPRPEEIPASASGVLGLVSLGTSRLHQKLLRERLEGRSGGEPVLVYGTCLEAYCAVQGI